MSASLYAKKNSNSFKSGQFHLPETEPLREVGFEEFQTVSPGIFGKKAMRTGQRVIFRDLYTVRDKRFTKLAKFRDSESRMRLFCRLERRFNANVNLLLTALEPATAPRT